MQPNAESNAKQLLVERIRQSTNILIAVSSDPSVDALAAALGFTLVLNKMDKHATAVFSGQIPPAMQFLEPSKTFTNTVDSLRDFIISLDKEKADRLRYKVEDDVVRIFITPYKTTITQDDLHFSQGDFNVELIIALGVEKREDLDKALIAHGRILHDATVVTMNANNQQSGLGAIDWHDPNASSLSEMLISLSESFGKPGLVDAQIATALLTGMVAATERFSNQHTSPRVMTMAAQMMAAGANQQLVANNLQVSNQPKPMPEVSAPKAKPAGQLEITHDKKEKPAPPAPQKTDQAEKELEAALPAAAAKPEPTLDDLKKELEEAAKSEVGPRKFITDTPIAASDTDGIHIGAQAPPEESATSDWRGRRLEPPAMGGTLNATSEQALEEKNLVEEEDRNKKILSHGTITPPQDAQPPKPEPVIPPMPPLPVTQPNEPAQPVADPVVEPAPEPPAAEPPVEPVATPATSTDHPPQQSIEALEAARKAVDEALAAQPFNPASQPVQSLNAQPLPTEPPQPAPTPAPAPAAPTQPGALPVIPPMPQLPVSEPGLPPMPPSLPPLPSAQPQSLTPPQALPQPPPQPSDPGQFKIPGSP